MLYGGNEKEKKKKKKGIVGRGAWSLVLNRISLVGQLDRGSARFHCRNKLKAGVGSCHRYGGAGVFLFFFLFLSLLGSVAVHSFSSFTSSVIASGGKLST
jgi:hypothetical protein